MHHPNEHVNTHIYQEGCINYQSTLAHQRRRLNKAAKQERAASTPEGLINQHDKLAEEPGRGQRQVQQVRRAVKEGWIITLTCSTAAYKGESIIYLHM